MPGRRVGGLAQRRIRSARKAVVAPSNRRGFPRQLLGADRCEQPTLHPKADLLLLAPPISATAARGLRCRLTGGTRLPVATVSPNPPSALRPSKLVGGLRGLPARWSSRSVRPGEGHLAPRSAARSRTFRPSPGLSPNLLCSPQVHPFGAQRRAQSIHSPAPVRPWGQNQAPRLRRTSRSTAGRSVMIPSTPRSSSACISSSSSIVHTCTWSPAACDRSTKRRSVTTTPL